MNPVFAAKQGKKYVRAGINSNVQQNSRDSRMKRSATRDAVVVDAIARRKRALWKVENSNAIAAYNRMVETFGVFGDGLRSY